MIDLHYWATPNGIKITIFLEEAGLDYCIKPVNIGKGDQFRPGFLRLSPNNRIPAIVDRKPADGGRPLSVFESGAILLYLAQKTGKFMPSDLRRQTAVCEWLMWQMGGFGPMLGQNHHFRAYAPRKMPYAIKRYTNEAQRLYNVLNKRLKRRKYICDDYSIVDMATYPWTLSHERQGIDLVDFPAVKKWAARMAARAAVQKSLAIAAKIKEELATKDLKDDAAAKKVLFNQTDCKLPAGCK